MEMNRQMNASASLWASVRLSGKMTLKLLLKCSAEKYLLCCDKSVNCFSNLVETLQIKKSCSYSSAC